MTRIQNSVQKSVINLNIIMKYLFVKFICEIYMFMHTFYALYISSIEFTVLYDSVLHDGSNA